MNFEDITRTISDKFLRLEEKSEIVTRLVGISEYVAEFPLLQFCIGIMSGVMVGAFAASILGILALLLAVAKFKKLIALGVGFLAIAVRVLLISNEILNDHIQKFNGESIEIEAVVTSDFVVKSDKTSVVVEALNVCRDGNCQKASGRIQTWIPRFPRVKTGDILVLAGDLRQPEDFENGDKFSYETYLAGKDIYSIMYRPEVTYTDRREIFGFYRWVLDFRDLMLQQMNNSLPEPHSSLLAGILLGVRRSMPADFSEALQRTGTTHVIAASGYNVTLVINAIVSVLKFLQRRARIFVSIIFVWIFVLMSGASLPVVRAAIMGCFALLAMATGNLSNIHLSLPFSGALMILISPDVAKSISFQLSFVSTAGLIYVFPVLEQMFPWVPESLKESTLITIAATVVTFPITAFNFGQFSVVSILANFLVLPVVEIVMMLGIVTVAMGLWDVVGTLVYGLLWVPLEYFVKAIELVSSISFAVVELPDFPGCFVVFFYLLVLFIVLKKYPAGVENNILFKDLRI